ncbi:MAG: PAS domain S-box protein [Candidatus Rokubacteria bacterium]|nr:PAS domain S-box protein [Candidatus Rokubacteria bacterium]
MTPRGKPLPLDDLDLGPIDELSLGARDALHLIVSLGDFQTRMARDQDAPTILGATRLLLRRLLPFKTLVFLTVNEADSDFEVAVCDPPERQRAVQRQIDATVDDGTFAWALTQRRAVLIPAREAGQTLVLHPLLTRSRIVGMFVGALDGACPKVTDVLLSVLSVILFSTAQALENAALYATMRETTVSKEVLEEALERYRALFDNANDVIYTHDLEGRFTSINPSAERVFGFERGEGLGRSVFDVLAPEHVEQAREMIAQTLREGAPPSVYELDAVSRDGTRTPLEVSARAILRAGRPVGVQGIARDVADRKRLEVQLRQSQKMEAVGRLAGGVAHDFNNLLMVIIGYADLLISRLRPGESGREQLDQMRKAADSAASLTRQLLAFSRRQVLQPRVLNLNAVVGGLDSMLRRLIGEDVELVTKRAPELGDVEADPGQIEQVIMNLAVNARDAMPRGGRLTIETANAAHQGAPHVMLAVSDTGEGMDPETASHIFEPFFTTKEMGKGTGLGLSMVYGIVQQHRGVVEVDTRVGRGTTFRIYLPRATAPAAAAGPPKEPQALNGAETVLLVEDEGPVRKLVREILSGYGYTVLEAPGGVEALAIFDRHGGQIDLLLTDVVMPGMSGRALAQRLIARRANLKVLYMSGYTDDVIGHHGVLDSQLGYLQKPFTPDCLAGKVREILDADGVAAGS